MQKLTKYLCGIIQQAAKLTDKPFNVYPKGTNGDVVTEIDKEVESFLIEKLNHKYPEFDILSEEFNPNQAVSSHCFVIDPIDGTKNFVAGLPLWGMQIAAIENSEVIASVIYLPKLNELYYADCSGAYLNGVRLEITTENQNQQQTFEIALGTLPDVIKTHQDVVNCNLRLFASASVAFAWVATGRLNGYVLRAKDHHWEYIPGMYLVKMAGGYTHETEDFHFATTNQEMLDYLNQFLSGFTVPDEDTVKKTTTKKTSATSKPAKSATKKSK